MRALAFWLPTESARLSLICWNTYDARLTLNVKITFKYQILLHKFLRHGISLS